VIAADLRRDLVEGLAQRLPDQAGRVFAAQLDVGSDAQAVDLVGRIVDRHGRLDILVNNAGTDKTLPVDELSFDDWDRVIQTNLRGPFVLCKCIWPLMKRQGGGHVVNIVSTAAKRAWANATAYHASKWGLLGLSHALHVEGRQHRIKVSAVISGGMRT